MSKDVVKYVILIIVGLFIFKTCLNYDTKEAGKKTIVIPEKSGVVEKIINVIHTDTVYITKVVNKEVVVTEVVVDSIYKALYDEAIASNDSIKARNLFLESITINTVKDTLVDNKDITISGEVKTRGTLLSLDVKYNIKKNTFEYTPKSIYIRPRLSFVAGLSAGLPGETTDSFDSWLGFKLGIQDKKGNIYTAGVNTNKQITVGFAKTFTIFN